MKKEEQIFTTEWLGRTLTIKTGKLAKQADAAVTVQYGDTVVMATVVEAKTEREAVDFFPLLVDFEERLYAAGIIKGSRWVKREGRPTDDAILTGRMVDRSIRPLFDDSSRKDIQIIITVLSVDQENDYDIVSLIAASASLAIAGVNWRGPISGIRVGRIDNKFVFNPTYEEQKKSDLNLIVAGTAKKIIMIEAGGKEIQETDMLEAIMAGQKEMQGALKLINELKKEFTPKKNNFNCSGQKLQSQDEINDEKEKEKIFAEAQAWLNKNIKPILFNKDYDTKGERKAAVTAIKEELDKYLFEQNVDRDKRNQTINNLVEKMVEAEITRAILEEDKRVDGRQLDEIREISAEAGILPRNHGSGVFARGETQVLSVVTLGSPGLEQTMEDMEGTSKKRYMHHYNFPPYSVGEVKPMRSPGRREIGHGALAEKALAPVIPEKEIFPYTIRVVSETLGSNGSSSMAATCGSTLALMDAGVPIKKPVGGIAIGLISNVDMSQWKILTDFQDLEDGQGGMDFKMAGTPDGLTAIQLDTKTDGLTEEIIKESLNRGRAALDQILEVMKKEISSPRAELSKYAPRIISFHIDPEKIGSVIGPSGKIINKIIEETGVTIDIENDGLVMVCGIDPKKCEEAAQQVKDIVREFKAGEIFTAKVVRLLDFGAFFELTPGHDGMAHVSELAPYRIGKPEDFLKVGDEVKVKIKEIDEKGRVNLTMKGLVENEHLWQNERGKSDGNSEPRFNNRNNGRSNNHRDNRGGRRRY